MSHNQHADTDAVNAFIADMQQGRIKVTAKDVMYLCRELHTAVQPLAEESFSNYSFATIADDWSEAIDSARAELEQEKYIASPNYKADLFAARSERGL